MMKKSLKILIFLFTALTLACILFACEPQSQPRTYTLTYEAGIGGKVEGTLIQEIKKGESGSSVTAVPTAGYVFDGWSDGVTTAARTDTNVSLDKTAKALFTEQNATQRLTYILNDNSYYSVSAGTATADEIIIPGIYKSLPVKEIHNYAFENCTSLVSIKIPSGVTNIGALAFSKCINLARVNSVKNGEFNLSGLTSLKSIDEGVFSYCASLVSVSFPSSVESIGSRAFWGCTSLSSIILPINLTSVDDAVFWDCTSLTSVNIPDSVTNIGSNAFYNCMNLASINIPDNVINIGRGAFSKCIKLARINSAKNGEFDLSKLTSLISIEDWTFENCTSLISITVPNNVTSIGARTFWYCENLNSVNLPSSLISIGEYAFYYCSSLKRINSIEDGEFDLNGLISLKNMDSNAFTYCAGLNSIKIPSSVTNIASDTFYGCWNQNFVFVDADNENYFSLDGVLFNKDKTTLIHYPVGKMELSYTIPFNITLIDDWAFSGANLISIAIPSSVTKIGKNAFSTCENLKYINSSIDWEFDLSGLTSLETISDNTFSYCNLISIFLPNSLKTINASTFNSCSKFTTIFVDADNKDYLSDNGVLFNKDKTTLVCYPAGKTDVSYEIPKSVEIISEYAFYNSNLIEITIPISIISIGKYAFNNCRNLKRINSIEDGEFDLSCLTSLTSISDHAFYNCISLVSVKIPNCITSIGRGAFYDCTKLTTIHMKRPSSQSIPTLENYVFDNCPIEHIYVPSDSVTAYKNAESWSNYSEYITAG